MLVHMYKEIDLEVLKEFLTRKLGDFEKFAGYLLEHIERKETEIENS